MASKEKEQNQKSTKRIKVVMSEYGAYGVKIHKSGQTVEILERHFVGSKMTKVKE